MNRPYLPPFFTLYDLPADSDERTLKRTYARELKKLIRRLNWKRFRHCATAMSRRWRGYSIRCKQTSARTRKFLRRFRNIIRNLQKTEAEPDHPEINGQTSYQKYRWPAPEIIARQAFSSLRAIVEKPQVTFSEIDDFLNTQVKQ
jgi:hypothetical protein